MSTRRYWGVSSGRRCELSRRQLFSILYPVRDKQVDDVTTCERQVFTSVCEARAVGIHAHLLVFRLLKNSYKLSRTEFSPPVATKLDCSSRKGKGKGKGKRIAGSSNNLTGHCYGNSRAILGWSKKADTHTFVSNFAKC